MHPDEREIHREELGRTDERRRGRRGPRTRLEDAGPAGGNQLTALPAAPARPGQRPRREAPTPAAVREQIRRAVVVVEETGADTTRLPENVGDLIDLATAAMRAGMPPRCTAALTNARRKMERYEVASAVAQLREALELAEELAPAGEGARAS